jgi:phosphatidylinositol alpha-1,6-mannosyltransferase
VIGYSKAFWQLRRLVKQYQPDQMHAASLLPEGLMALALKRWLGVPYFCFVHGEDVGIVNESRELRWLARQVIAGADLLIANSRNTVRLLREALGVRPEQIRLLHPGVDTGKFQPAQRDAAVRAQLGWFDRPVVLTVGRLQKRKGQDQMILALHTVRRNVPDVLYAILGDGEERIGLEALAAREGLTAHVIFMGERSDAELVQAYQQCDLFVLPNRQVGPDIEGFGMVLLEAQACGKAVIAGASGGTAEAMSIPETGCVIDCSTSAELGPLVATWLADSPGLSRMGQAGRIWVVNGFDWSVLTRRAETLFRQRPSCESVGDCLATQESYARP